MPVINQAQIKQAGNEAQNALQTIPGLKDTLTSKAKTMMAQIPMGMAMMPKNAQVLIDSAKKAVRKNTGNAVALPPVALPEVKKDTSHIKRDSIFMTGDTIETQMTTFKSWRTLREQRRLAAYGIHPLRLSRVLFIPSPLNIWILRLYT